MYNNERVEIKWIYSEFAVFSECFLINKKTILCPVNENNSKNELDIIII